MAKEPIETTSHKTLQVMLDKKFMLEGIKIKANIKEEISKELTEKNGYIYLQMKFKEGLQTTMIKNNNVNTPLFRSCSEIKKIQIPKCRQI